MKDQRFLMWLTFAILQGLPLNWMFEPIRLGVLVIVLYEAGAFMFAFSLSTIFLKLIGDDL